METQAILQLKRNRHRYKAVISLHFEYDEGLQGLLRQVPGSRWSQTLRAWYVEERAGLLDELFAAFKGRARLDDAALNMGGGAVEINKAVEQTEREKRDLGSLSVEQEQSIIAFANWMSSRRYSTISTYTDALKTFLRFYSDKTIREITNEDIVKFNNEYILKNKLSA